MGFRWQPVLCAFGLMTFAARAQTDRAVLAPPPTASDSRRTHSTDCKYLYRAMQQAGFKLASARAARNYLAGPEATILAKDEAPWAGNYFPMMDGGLANRWRLRKPVETTLDIGKDGRPLSRKKVIAKIQKMTPDEISKLSPAEKLDIHMGYYDFRITKRELKARGPQRPLPVQDWEGFCNGVRAAGICLPEPKNKIAVTNRDGIEVAFEPSDLKGLSGASYFYTEKYAAMGSPTMTPGLKNETPPNAGSFDVALRSYLGTERRAFVIDNHPGTEIWNVSVVGYDRKITSVEPFSAAAVGHHSGAVEKVHVRLDLDYLGEAGISESNRSTTARVANRTLTRQMHYKYDLYVDETGRILDGAWVGDAPDMAWFPGGAGIDDTSGGSSSNVHLDYNTVRELVEESAGKVGP